MNFKVIPYIGTLMLLISWCTQALADKLPRNRHFPEADYPFAQAPDGCSGLDSDIPEEVRDNWGIVDFTDSCNKHDICYYTLGTDSESCNKDFKADLIDACEDKVEAVPAFFATLPLCKQIAVAYWAGAVVAAEYDHVYDDAQELQQDYQNYADQVFTDIFKKLTGRTIRGGDIRRARATLLTGSLLDVESQIVARYGGEIVQEAYRRIAGGTLSEPEIHTMMGYLQSYGFDRLAPELMNRYTQRIIVDLHFEIKGTRTISPVKLLLYKNRLIDSKDPEQVRSLIRYF
ncbi:MAG: hypothetical protein ACOH5I_06420 [Oligoflexus sp.]